MTTDIALNTLEGDRTLSSLINDCRLILCDLWGVLHDGRTAFAVAVAALEQARKAGIGVVLVSNSPERADIVESKLMRLGIMRGRTFDGLVTSGALCRDLLARDHAGQRVFLLGPEQDAPTIENLPVVRVDDMRSADVLLATGLLFPDAGSHRPMLEAAAVAGISMICANPDRIVRHAGEWEICAGVIADLYQTIGGEVIWTGKPAAAPYEAARRAFPAEIPWRDMLMIGDSLITDIKGANALGITSLLIRSGIHSEEFGKGETLEGLSTRFQAWPDHSAQYLVWA